MTHPCNCPRVTSDKLADVFKEFGVLPEFGVTADDAEGIKRKDSVEIIGECTDISGCCIQDLVTLFLKHLVGNASQQCGEGKAAIDERRHGLVKSADGADDIFGHGALIRIECAEKFGRLLKDVDGGVEDDRAVIGVHDVGIAAVKEGDVFNLRA